jgi:oligopeptide/dipeptide ABC transporter ATP-binding protein
VPGRLLEVQNLTAEIAAGRSVVTVSRGLSLSIDRGEALALVGESGSGKSMSALALLNLLPRPGGRVTGGSVRLGGRELVGLPEPQLREIRGAEVSIVFQDALASLNPVLSVGSQIREAIERHTPLRGKAAVRRVTELLSMVEIPDARRRIDDYPHQFSGGMRQRVMLAMALSCEPALLIADEPTTALDVTVQAQVLDLLDRLRRELGMAILLITHDLGVAAGSADRVAIMYAGRIVESGDMSVLARPSHPYTAGLLRSIPQIDGPVGRLVPIEGRPPDLSLALEGCPFRPRCGRAIDRCAVEDPPLTLRRQGDWAACWNPLSEQLPS